MSSSQSAAALLYPFRRLIVRKVYSQKVPSVYHHQPPFKMRLPPGLLYVLPRIPQLLAAPAAVYVASHVARTQFGVTAPTWLLVLAYVLCWPIALTLYIQWRDYKISREAAAAGAVLPPAVEAKYLGGLDLIGRATKDFDAHIMGACISCFSSLHHLNTNVPRQDIDLPNILRNMAIRSTSAPCSRIGWVYTSCQSKCRKVS